VVVPDSKAAKTKIARNKNASGNSASAKNKAVAANKAVAGNRVAAISREATSKADDNLVLSDYSDGGGQLPPFACPCADAWAGIDADHIASAARRVLSDTKK
jgi:hypothetical protein